MIPGNHETADQVAGFCRAYGLHNFHERRIEIGQWHVAGLGYSSPTPFDTPGEYSEAELAERLDRFAGLKPLVAHLPRAALRHTLDRITPEAWRQPRRPRLYRAAAAAYFFCGHIHEAEGIAEKLGETRAMNVGKKGYLLELD